MSIERKAFRSVRKQAWYNRKHRIFTHKMLSFTKNDWILIFQFYSRSITLVRVFQKLPEIFQKVSFNISKKKCSKVAEKKNNQKMVFITKAAQMLLGKIKTFCGLVLKYANSTTKGRFYISKHFCAILRCNQRC